MKMTTPEEKLKRVSISYSNENERFKLKERRFNLQYAQLYSVRLMTAKAKIESVMRNTWGDKIRITNISDLKFGEECCLIGTMFKKMLLQPSILKDLSDDAHVPLHPNKIKYIDETDELLLEDDTQRVSLSGNIDIKKIFTGCVVGLKGKEENGGKFFVDEICYSGIPDQTAPNLDQSLINGNDDVYIILMSSLNVGGEDFNPFNLQLFIDLVSGYVGNAELNTKMAKVGRVIIAGNLLGKNAFRKELDKLSKYSSRNTEANSVEHVAILDEFLAQLGAFVPVSIMPGDLDPSNNFLPQQPLHNCMFPKAMVYDHVEGSTNPLEAKIGGLSFLGTSGQPINDIDKYSEFEDVLDIMEMTLRCGHMAPTCPDTLACYPYYKEDPFFFSECPNVYFAGNQPTFGYRQIKGSNGQSTLLVSIPKFHESNQVVLVNLKNKSCFAIEVNSLF